MSNKFFLFFTLCHLTLLLLTATAQTLSPDHWSQETIKHFQNRGKLWLFSPFAAPYANDSVLTTLNEIKESYLEYTKNWLNIFPQKSHYVFGHIESNNRLQDTSELQHFWGTQRIGVGAKIKPWFTIMTSVLADNQLNNDPHYLGKHQAGMASYTERAYGLIQINEFTIKFGRDFLVWGPGRDAAMLISANSRPMDQIYLSYQHSWLRYDFFTATLDASTYPINDAPSRQQRYLSGHRLEIRPWKYFYIAICEAMSFGGPDFGTNFAFVNPFIFYHGAQLNGPDNGNTIGSLQVAVMPIKNITLYADLMIDDVQLEHSVRGDLEPDEVGILGGINIADPVGVKHLDIYAEYTRITNRTYNSQGGPWEKWLHRREPIGHFLGNDFDRMMIGADYWPRLSWRAGLEYEHRRRGEGRIEKTFDTPWLDYTLEEGYSEPFPTGVVETSDILSASLTWQPRWWGRLFVQASHWSVSNPDHVTDASDSYWTMQAGVQVDWGAKWQLP